MKLQVLMSTYNGEKYLREQLDSIFAQTLIQSPEWEVELVVRDDGSVDNTCKILEEYNGRYPQLTYQKGENKGVVASFFELIQKVPDEVDFVALSDQDDVWMADKLEAAVRALTTASQNGPLLYCSMCQPVDEALRPIAGVFFTENIRPSFGNALVENICTGCTAVFNREMARLVCIKYSEDIVMHDWWLYLSASCFGQVIYDKASHMYYRQHGDNTVGVSGSYFSECFARLRRFKKNRYHISRQLQAFVEICKEHGQEIPEEKRNLIELVLAGGSRVGKRVELLRDNRVYRQRRGDNLIFKVIILLGNM